MNNTVFITPAAAPSSDKLLAAVFVAIVIHICAILGLNFTVPEPEKVNKSIAITLVNTPSEKVPEKANFLAQDNQVGAGRKKQKATPPAQKIHSLGESQQAKNKLHNEVNKTSESNNKIITQKQSELKNNSKNNDRPKTKPNKPDQPTTELSMAMLSKQITQIGVDARDQQLNAENSRIKFIDSVSAHKYQAASYIKQWQNKVERIGNLNYPAMARQKGFFGRLTMDVGINPDGSIYNIRIRQSSGNKSLDDAATSIVRMGAPYAPLPKDLHEELDVLVISRVWRFSDETGMSGQ